MCGSRTATPCERKYVASSFLQEALAADRLLLGDLEAELGRRRGRASVADFSR